jgi:hypothetical protein
MQYLELDTAGGAEQPKASPVPSAAARRGGAGSAYRGLGFAAQAALVALVGVRARAEYRGTRPADPTGGGNYLTLQLCDDDRALLEALAAEQGVTPASMIRRLIRDEGRSLALRQAFSAAGERALAEAKEFYETDPETRAWIGAGGIAVGPGPGAAPVAQPGEGENP